MPAKINYAKCSNCGKCYDNCALDVFAPERGLGIYTVKYKEDCWHCGACVLDCPQEAIELTLPFSCL